jgi:ribosomal protein S18 acetylase RimI-like enzyme
VPIDENKLDNPVWHSLSESHHHFSIERDNAMFYHPDYCPFGAFIGTGNISKAIDKYAEQCGNFYIVGEKPTFSSALYLRNELVCNQMIIFNEVDLAIQEEILEIGQGQANKLFQLVNLVQPGYFKSKTSLLGNYYGIFKDNELIAVTGERMKMNNYTEVSAVITHPAHIGKGYAKQLVAHTVNSIIQQNKLPYLHVAETNSPAIKLYEKLGFTIRRRISFWNLEKNLS